MAQKNFLFRLFSRSYFVSLNLCLVVIGVLRPIWLFHDPYNEELSWPRPVAYLLVDTGLPCMTSAFAVLFLALLRATQIELVSTSFQVLHSLMIHGLFYGVNEVFKGTGEEGGGALGGDLYQVRSFFYDLGLYGLTLGLVTSNAN